MKYRAEIDGLRALAVIPVILYHAGIELFSGGFVGVDVFFVISGYLITTILIEDIENNRFSIINFYERRARRILPALFLVMVVCIPFAWMWMLPAQLKEFSDSIFSTSLGLSNLYFMSQQGYFGLNSEIAPLLHTWSLGVEEQYYFLFPGLLYFIYKRNLNAIAIILTLSALSFAVSEWGWRFRPDKNYFFTFSRLWELGAGTIVALVIRKQGVKHNNLLALLGLFTIVFAIFVYDKSTPFPGVYTLTPIIGVALLVLFADSETFAAKFLSSRLLVGIGLISYSAYLWHQPLFAFARIHSISATNSTVMILLSVISIILAYFSWKYIEKPFRDRTKITKSMTFSAALVGVFSLSTLGVVGHLNNGFIERIPDWNKISSIPTVTTSYCHNAGSRDITRLMRGDFCTIGKGEVRSAIIGDSHAGALFDYADKYLADKKQAAWAISGGFCAPLMNGFEARKGCRESTKIAFEKIIQNSNIRDVILVAEWAIYTKGYRGNDFPQTWKDNLGTASSVSENPVLFKRSLVTTINQLRQANKRISIVMPVPEFHYRTYEYVAQQMLIANKHLVDAVASLPEIPLDEYFSRNKDVFDVFTNVANEVQFVDVTQLFCNKSICRAHAKGGELPFYSDFNHVNYAGAKLIVNHIFETLRSRNIVLH